MIFVQLFYPLQLWAVVNILQSIVIDVHTMETTGLGKVGAMETATGKIMNVFQIKVEKFSILPPFCQTPKKMVGLGWIGMGWYGLVWVGMD